MIGERTGIHKGWSEDGDGITDIKGAYISFARLDKEQKNSDLFQGGHKSGVMTKTASFVSVGS